MTGFYRIAVATPRLFLGNAARNAQEMEGALRYRRRSDTSLAERPVDLASVLTPVAANLPTVSPKTASATPFLDEYGEGGWHRKIL